MKNDSVTEYAKQVMNNDVVCGKYHYLAAKRHLEDLEKQKSKNFEYSWDIEASERIIKFAEMLQVIEGFEKINVKLLPFQKFILGNLFGWKNKEGFRRFRRSYISMARQNGKTFLNGIMATYIGNFCNYNYGKLFTVATKKRQAKIAWDEVAKFVRADEDLRKMFDVKEYKTLITCKKTNSTIEALSKEAGLDDGFRSIFSSIDEIHQHKNNYIYKAIYNGTASLKETLISMITTRGFDISPQSFSYEFDKYATQVLSGATTADDLFVDIHCLDEDDDLFDRNNWIKANPYLISNEFAYKTLEKDAKTANDMGSNELKDFSTKRLNLWYRNGNDAFVDLERFLECGTERTLEDFMYKNCWVGIDLSSGGDLTSIALEFEENDRFFIHSHSFMPRGRLVEHIKSDIAPYDVWENKELITITGGKNDYKNDYKFIIKYLKDIIEKYKLTIKAIGYDPHNADGFLSDLEEFGADLYEIQQTAKFLNDATVDTQLNVKSGSIEYNKNNELLVWSFSNAKLVANSMDDIKVDKEPKARYKRIDPVDAVIDAHTVYMKTQSKLDIAEQYNNYLNVMEWN